jgi:hypothetical protein
MTMTPRQGLEMVRLQKRNAFLEQWNNEQRSALRALQKSRTVSPCPKAGANLVMWLVDAIDAATTGRTGGGYIKVSKADLKAVRTLLAWIERQRGAKQ